MTAPVRPSLVTALAGARPGRPAAATSRPSRSRTTAKLFTAGRRSSRRRSSSPRSSGKSKTRGPRRDVTRSRRPIRRRVRRRSKGDDDRRRRRFFGDWAKEQAGHRRARACSSSLVQRDKPRARCRAIEQRHDVAVLHQGRRRRRSSCVTSCGGRQGRREDGEAGRGARRPATSGLLAATRGNADRRLGRDEQPAPEPTVRTARRHRATTTAGRRTALDLHRR